jgi:hypothetical protein
MKNAIAILMLATASVAYGEKPAANPADYTIAVHVQRSQLVEQCVSGLCGMVEHMDVVIDGKKFELSEGSYRQDLLRVGDYKAKILKDETTRAYEYLRTYEFVLPDGKTRDYIVVAEEE